MGYKINNYLNNLKSFDWKMFIALCALALVPAIYQTTITNLINTNTEIGNLDIIGQMEWFDLINETICAFLIVPMYSLLTKARKSEFFSQLTFKFGLVVFLLYIIFSLVVFFYGINLVTYMNPNEIDIVAAYSYLSFETIAFMIGIVFSYTSVVFIVIDKARYMYAFLITKILVSLLSDFFLIPVFGVNEVAFGNIIANFLIGFISIFFLLSGKYIKISFNFKKDLTYFKDRGRIGLLAGLQQFLDNFIYAIMVVRMVNAVSESGNYWVSNNFIWGWLLIPITCLSEIIRKDAGENGYNLKQINYYSIVTITVILWFIFIPTYEWFFANVEKNTNPHVIFSIVIKSLGFYVAYALTQIPDNIFVGLGKTKYTAINSIICNIVYYGIWFLLYQN